LITPRALTRLLAGMYASADGDTYQRDTFIGLLPVGGEDGTLSNRLCCVSDARNIHAKTGTLARSISLSGYADSKTYGMLAFSIIVNNFAPGGIDVRAWVDKMALELVE
jgi:D-alanyl-D-alanine carboxypeptidase